MKILADLELSEIADIMAKLDAPSFRAKQILSAITQGKDYAQTTLPHSLITELQNDYILKPANIVQTQTSRDGTVKYLFECYDKNTVECVFLRQSYGNTICLSTQIGCRMGCSFCASTIGGFVRNLSVGEMLSMVAVINAEVGKAAARNFTNIVLMGSGEPLENFDNVISFLRRINSTDTFNISMRNISLSTCGLVERIYDLLKLDLDITLCISLHASNDEIRRKIMPIAHKYSIDQIIVALKDYVAVTKRRVILEYCLIDGINDDLKYCKELAEKFKGMMVHFNIIRINPYDAKYHRPSEERAKAFVEELSRQGLSATIRASKGIDIQGACGQLKNKYYEKK